MKKQKTLKPFFKEHIFKYIYIIHILQAYTFIGIKIMIDNPTSAVESILLFILIIC